MHYEIDPLFMPSPYTTRLQDWGTPRSETKPSEEEIAHAVRAAFCCCCGRPASEEIPKVRHRAERDRELAERAVLVRRTPKFEEALEDIGLLTKTVATTFGALNQGPPVYDCWFSETPSGRTFHILSME